MCLTAFWSFAKINVKAKKIDQNKSPKMFLGCVKF